MYKSDFQHTIYIGDTKELGKGVFANRTIKKGEIIDILKGEVLELNRLVYWDRTQYWWWQIGKTAWLKAEPPCSHVNHSCSPNGAVVDILKLIALRSIKKGEEITVDYDITDWDESAFPLECRCGKRNCRKIVRGYRYLLPKAKERYKRLGIVPQFLLALEEGE